VATNCLLLPSGVGEKLSETIVEKRMLLDEAVLGKLSPLQQRILVVLSEGPLTLDLLSERTGSSVYTIGKQLSLLQLRAKYNPLESKGITEPLIRKEKDRGIKTTYFLT